LSKQFLIGQKYFPDDDLVLTDHCSAHEGWNTGPNLATSANYLDTESAAYINKTLFSGDRTAHWYCQCGCETTAALHNNQFDIDDAGDTPTAALYQWIHSLQPHCDIENTFLMSKPV
jgi:hypothetical protein